MKPSKGIWTCIGLLAAFAVNAAAPAQPYIGVPEVVLPKGMPSAAVVLFSGAAGWGEVERALAGSLAERGQMVMGVDLAATLRRMRTSSDTCITLIGEIEAVSHQVQREAGARSYHFPVLAGIGAGGTVALAVAAQAAIATIDRVVAVDPDPLLPPTKPLCAAAPLRNPSGGIGHEQPDGALPFPVELHLSASVTPAERSQAEAFARDRQGVSLKEGRHTAATALLKALDKQPIAAAAAAAAAENVSDLPLIELPVARMGDTFAVLYSGDGGWRDLDKELAAILQREGLPVVGVDVLRYFWTRRTPEQGARDLARVIHAYRQKWGAKKVVLIGFSFGADVLPAVFNRLSAEDKASVAQMSLLGFSAITDFEVTVSGWLSHGQGDTLPALAEVRRVDAHRVQCFYGEEDEKSACVPIGGGVEVIRTQGSHHFDGDYEALAQHILKGLKSRTTP